MKNKQILITLMVFLLTSSLLLVACTATNEGSSVAVEETDHDDGHMDMDDGHMDMDDGHMDMDDEHMDMDDGHMEGMHTIPPEAEAMPNPIEATDESIEMGANIFAKNCVVCHGENGEGDGPAAASLEPKPADLHEDHVQLLSDGALFYIITHGEPNTAMPAWGTILSEDERWQVVNFLRTFNDGS